jgi:PAS domain S-box-containing protein
MRSTIVKAAGWMAVTGLILAAVAYGVSIYRRRNFDDRVYRIGWQADPPFQERGEDGAPTGLAIELVRDAARRQGIRLEWVWRPGSSEEALRNRTVDLWPLLTITPERKRVLHISDPYMQHENCFLVRASSPYIRSQDLKGAEIGYLSVAINERLIHAASPGARLRISPSVRDAIADVCEQRTDAAFLDEFTAIGALLGGLPCSGQPLRLIADPTMRIVLGIGSTREAAAVADQIREGIGAAAEDGEMMRILTRWGYLSPRNIESMTSLLNAKQRERWLIAAIALFGCLLGLTVFETDRIRRQKNRIKTTELAYRESEQKLRLMANNLSEMVLAYDMEHHLVFTNPAVEKVTGYSLADLQEKTCISLVHPNDKPLVLGYWDDLFQGPVYRDAEFRIITKDGQTKWLSAAWGPMLDDEGRQVGVQGSERDITQRKDAEEALHESELRFRKLLEGVQLLAIMIDVEGTVCFCNDYALSITGWTAEEVVGHLAKEFLDPEYLGQLAEAMDGSEPAGPQRSSEGTFLTKEGTRRWIQWNSLALRDATGRITSFASLGADVTELQSLRAEAAKSESEAHFRSLADTAPVMIWVAGQDKGRTFFNKGWLAFTGRTMEQERGHGWVEGVHPDDLERCFRSYSSSFDARKSFHIEYRLRRADGEYRWVLDSGVPSFAPGSVFDGYIGSCIDLTDVKRAHEEMLATQKLESLGMLTAGIAHDFNNFLGSILAQTEVAETEIAAGSLPEDEVQSIKVVAMRAAEVVREMMIYAGQDKANLESVDVSQLAEEMLQLFKVSISKNAVLKTDFGKNLPSVLGNVAQIRQIVMNLIINASEAIGEKAGSISVTTSRMSGGGDLPGGAKNVPRGEFLRLEVSDTGCGIAKSEQAKIFDPYYTTKFAGRGLGLSVVQGIVRDHGGMIHLASTPGEGTTFQILLPSAIEPAPQERSDISAASPEQTLAGAGSVLLVEDEEPLRLAVSKMLRRKGLSVIQAADGSAAIDLIRRQKERIDVILLDMTIPGASSREVLLEAVKVWPDVRIIVTSAHSRETVTRSLDAPQIRGFVRKPFLIGDLVQLLSDTLPS